jgi:hypothetical protein
MELKKSVWKDANIYIWFLALLLIACQGVQVIEAEDRISLFDGGPHTGSWESSDVILKYEYIREPGLISMKVQGEAKGKYDQLTVWVFFLDTQGQILQTRTVFNTGYIAQTPSERPRKESTEITFEVPMETNHLAFRSNVKPYSFGRP